MTQQQQLRDRTKKFARDIIRLCRSLPNEWGVRVAGSDKEFCSRMGVVVEDADELVAIFGAAHRTATTNLEKRQSEKRKGARKEFRRAPRSPDDPITR